MLHVPTASLADATLAEAPAAPPLKAWDYLRLRRQSAGLSIDDVATRLSPRIATRSEAAELVRLLESPGWKAKYGRTLLALAEIFPMDTSVYHRLAFEADEHHPQVCRGCGCSYWDTIRVRTMGPLAWAVPGVMCTGCAADQAFAA